MSLFNRNNHDFELLKELYAAPTQYYNVVFKYYDLKNPTKIENLQFVQMDSEPFFPRINRFYEFCNTRMENKFKFIDYEIENCFTTGPRYVIDIENEFRIH